MQNSRETQLLLLLSRIDPDAQVLASAQALINGALDWEKFARLSAQHGTEAMVHKNLPELRNVPSEVCDKLRGIYHNSLKRNILMISELDRIIDLLEKAGVEIISLKGASASETIFGDIGAYPSDDIDILVNVGDVDRVRKILETDGYKLNDVGFDEYRDYFIKELYHINLSNGTFTVEPHWNLFMRYFVTPPEFWWEESIVVSSGGRHYRFLSPEKNVLYNSFRLFSHAFSYLRFLSIVAEIIRHYRAEIDWGRMFAYAKRFNFENVLSAVLLLASDLLGAPVPREYAWASGLRTKTLYNCAGRMLMGKNGEDNNFNALYKASLTILSTNFSTAFRILFRRVFPPVGEIVSRYRITGRHGKVMAYYLLNPVILLKRKTKV